MMGYIIVILGILSVLVWLDYEYAIPPSRKLYRQQTGTPYKPEDIDSLISTLILLGVGLAVLIALKVGEAITGSFGGADAPTNIIVGAVVGVATGGPIVIYQHRKKKRAAEASLRALELADVDHMDGLDFEHYVGRLLANQGFRVQVTAGSGDFGVDVIAQRDDNRYAIQVKRHTGRVSRRAVSDAVAGKDYYGCNRAIVVTNSYFSRSAIELAEATECDLIDRDILANWIFDYQGREENAAK